MESSRRVVGKPFSLPFVSGDIIVNEIVHVENLTGGCDVVVYGTDRLGVRTGAVVKASRVNELLGREKLAVTGTLCQKEG